MIYRALLISIQISLLSGIGTLAQNTCGSNKLACLLPTALHTNPPTFNFFNQTFATQIGQLPLATPASGFILRFDKRAGVTARSQESFGPLAAERIETIGRHQVYLAFTFQEFSFDELDGNNLGTLPLVFDYPSTTDTQVITGTKNRISARVNQYVIFGTFGVTDNLDVSVAVPISRVALGVSTTGTEYSVNTPATASFVQTLAGVASGAGDVVLAGKGTLLKSDRFGLAFGMELRLPSGDEQNFLGSGAFGIKPYVALARRGKVAPHINLIYQANGRSTLTKDASGSEQPLPKFFGYTIGADMGLLHSMTFAVDLVGQHFFDAPRITTATTKTYAVGVGLVPLASVYPSSGGYEVDNLAVGFKANLVKRLLFVGNATIKLNDGGLRANIVPLVGLSYTF